MSLSEWYWWAAAPLIVGALFVWLDDRYLQTARAMGAVGMVLLSWSAYYDKGTHGPIKAAWVAFCMLLAIVDLFGMARHAWKESNACTEECQGQGDVESPEVPGRDA